MGCASTDGQKLPNEAALLAVADLPPGQLFGNYGTAADFAEHSCSPLTSGGNNL
jgi:hypothetical protein